MLTLLFILWLTQVASIATELIMFLPELLALPDHNRVASFLINNIIHYIYI
jgi:hypothetical protein